MITGAEIADFLGVSEEEKETLRQFHKKQEDAERWKYFSEEQKTERLAKLTASSDHRLMAGVDDTPEERAIKIKGSVKRKSELIELATSMQLKVSDSMTMQEIADKMEPLVRDQLSKGALTYIEEKIIEKLTGKPVSDFENEDMINGKQMEEETVWWFEKNYGPLVVTEWGLKQKFHKKTSNKILKGFVGCTPDGYVKAINYGFEGKAPKYKTHYRYLFGKKSDNILPLRRETFKEVEPRYYWQIIKGLLITGWDGWVFTSYSPDFVNHHERDITFFIKREEVKDDIKKLEKVSELAVKEMKSQIIRNSKAIKRKVKESLKQKKEILASIT